jgi:hypothetical protein
MKYIHHPLRRLRAELILAYYEGRIDRGTFEKLYKMTEYEYGGPDVKRNNALEATTRAAPQTHTHGDKNKTKTQTEERRIKFVVNPPLYLAELRARFSWVFVEFKSFPSWLLVLLIVYALELSALPWFLVDEVCKRKERLRNKRL